jgi:hypothetical protein
MKYFEYIIESITTRDVVISLIFLFIGLASSWWISFHFYEKSLADSKASAAEEKRISQLLFRGIESQGTIKYSRDVSGRVVGVEIEFNGQAVGNATASGILSSTPSKMPNKHFKMDAQKDARPLN